ncbi:helix-turn-helix domain-containing protein [Agromyces soli]
MSSADRPDYWSAGITEHFFPVRVDVLGTPSFDARLSGGEVGPLFFRAISGPAHRVARTHQMVASSDPECVLFYLVRRGACRIEQGGRSCEIRAGDAAIHDTSRPSSFEALEGFDVQVVTFPKWFLGGLANAVASRSAERIAGTRTPLIQLASPLIAGLARASELGGIGGSEGERAAEMLLPVVRGLFSDPGIFEASGWPNPLPTRMRQYALAHLSEPELGPEQIARAHHVSVRYVHKLFATEGGVSAWIREQRLEVADRELRETDRPVADIAFRLGYLDATSFSRAFRKARGRSPRELRRAG